MADYAFQIRSHAFKAADGDGLPRIEASAAAGRFAGTIASAPENRREHIRFPIDHVGFCIFALGDQANILRHVGVRRARPLAIYNSVEVFRVTNVGGLQNWLPEVLS